MNQIEMRTNQNSFPKSLTRRSSARPAPFHQPNCRRSGIGRKHLVEVNIAARVSEYNYLLLLMTAIVEVIPIS